MLRDLGHVGQEEDERTTMRGRRSLAKRGRRTRTGGPWASCSARWWPSSLLLDPVGWIIAAAVLFWGVAYALGSRRPVFDIGVRLVMSSVIQLIFGACWA